MFILFFIVGAILVALWRGGRPANLLDVPFRFFYLLFVPLIPQLIIFSPLVAFLPTGLTAVPVIHALSMLLGVMVVWLNRELPGFKWLLAGLLSNLLVIVLNGGYMPVSMDARAVAGLPPFTGVYNNIVAMTSTTPFWFLGDIIPIPRGIPFANVFSIGDALTTLGTVWFIQRTFMPPNPAPMTAPET